MNATRCVNIDWLEIFCLESLENYPMNADYYRQHGWVLSERDYGTRVYNEMFVLMGTDGEPLLEIRRNPKSSTEQNGILDKRCCHIRLVNRTCYFSDCVDQLRNFCVANGYTIQRIARLDICLDFEKFDYGDDPAKFLRRYLEHKYAKINQAEIALRGQDLWDGRNWNSVSWGSPTSAIRTRFYDKTMELKQKKDKPYIRQAWCAAGLIDDWFNLTKKDADGNEYKPRIWRVEFAITSGTRNWFVMEHDRNGKRKKQSVRHTLAMWDTKQKQLDMFLSLADHYFHFKKVEYLGDPKAIVRNALSAIQLNMNHRLCEDLPMPEKRLRRKDRCTDKELFKISEANEFYKLENIASSKPSSKPIDSLLRQLTEYRDKTKDPNVYKACNTICDDIRKWKMLDATTISWPVEEIMILRQVLARRIKGTGNTLEQDIAETKALLELGDLFGEK